MERLREVTDEMWKKVNKETRDLVEEFLEINKHLSKQSVKQYTSGLRQFFYYVYESVGDKVFYKITKRDFMKYMNFLMERGLSSSGMQFKKSAISTFCNYIENIVADEVEEYKTFRNFTKGSAPMEKVRVNEKQVMTKEERELLYKVLEEKEEWQKLAYAKFSFATGARRAEVRQIKKNILDSEKIIREKDGRSIVYYNTEMLRCKGRGVNGKQRQLQFDQEAMDAIKKWLEIRGEDECEFVFVSKYDKKVSLVSESTFNEWCSITFTDIVGHRVHPHQFRSSRATSLVLEDGKDIRSAQVLLGHNSSETTEIYVLRNNTDDLDDVF